MSSRRTCDRCYKVKARCAYEETSRSCERCRRLGHICLTSRAVLRAGRPRITAKTIPISEKGSSPLTSSVDTLHFLRITPDAQLLPVLKGFKSHEVTLIEFVLHPDQIASLTYGQSFSDGMQSAMLRSLLTAPEELKDAYLAFAHAMSDNRNVHLRDLNPCAHGENGSRALQKLRGLEGCSLTDIRIALDLALILVTYNDLKIGAPTLPISRSALLRAAPWRAQLLCETTEETDPYVICVLFIEMFECLVLSEIPVFRVELSPTNTTVDRFYGISHELLPYMYDICHLYRDIKNDTILDMEKFNRIAQLNFQITAWDPEMIMLQRGHTISDSSEKAHFLLQAKAFKLTMQLLLLQAQRDPVTEMLASSKAVYLKSMILQAMQDGYNKPKYLLFPYFVSCLEWSASKDMLGDSVLDNMNEISNGNAPKACESMMMCLNHIWRNRRHKPGLCWFECVDRNMLFGMGP